MKIFTKIGSTLFLLIFIYIHESKAENPDIHSIINNIHLDSLVKTVEEISGEVPVIIDGTTQTISSRSYSNPGNELAFQYLKSRFEYLDYDVDSQKYSSSGKNLWAYKLGKTHPKRIVIMGAHYDNVPYGGIAPGADDNGSGIAAVLEAARVLKDIDLDYTIILALWDEEELGLIGSKAYAPSVGSDNDTLIGYINLDMIAWDSDDDGSVEIQVKPTAQSLDLLDNAIYCNEEYQIGLSLKIINPAGNESDYASFWNNNLSAIGINEEYYDDFNPYYHSTEDKLEYFNLDYFYNCTQLAIATLIKTASKESITVNIADHYNPDKNIIIYPNPFTDVLNIYFKVNTEEKTLSLFDLSGKIILETNSNQYQLSIPIENIPTGVYFLRVESQNHSYTKKLFKL